MQHDVRLTPEAAPLRRALAPSTWLVLEQLAMTVDVEGVASTSSRLLAAELGLSKDTMARALQRLIVGGLIERVEQRSAATGRFGPIAYRVDLPASGLVVMSESSEADGAEPTHSEATVAPTSRQRATARTSPDRQTKRATALTPRDPDQLELFRG